MLNHEVCEADAKEQIDYYLLKAEGIGTRQLLKKLCTQAVAELIDRIAYQILRSSCGSCCWFLF